MLLLLLRDLRLERVAIGHGRNRGFGKVRLVELRLAGLTPADSPIAKHVDGSSVAGFHRFEALLNFDEAGYPSAPWTSALTLGFREAITTCREVIRNGRAHVA